MWLAVCRCPKIRFYNVVNNVGELRLFNYTRKKQVLYSTQSFSAPVRPRRAFLIGLIGVSVGALVGGAYSYYRVTEIRPIPTDSKETTPSIIKSLPNIPITRQIVSPTDNSALDLVLFQYPTCPFCCKVRAFLDYVGLSYSVVEVNPVMRQQIRWSPYKKVPILLVKVDGGYQPLNDSSAIISILATYLQDKVTSIQELVTYYPAIKYHDDNMKRKSEIMNRYFLMYQNNAPQKSIDEIKDERDWRKWADDVLVHTLSPNVYRTREEAIDAFKWFSTVGEWERIFPSWEVNMIIYVGAAAMWLIGKQLKRRHGLKDDVRQSLYDDCNTWVRELRGKRTQFHGGDSPSLADLAVYGVLSSIEGCEAFKDALQNTKIGDWYWRMKKLCEEHRGVLVNSEMLVAH